RHSRSLAGLICPQRDPVVQADEGRWSVTGREVRTDGGIRLVGPPERRNRRGQLQSQTAQDVVDARQPIHRGENVLWGLPDKDYSVAVTMTDERAGGSASRFSFV